MSGLDKFFESRTSNKDFKLIKEENSYLDSLKELYGSESKTEILNERGVPAPFLKAANLPVAKSGPRTQGSGFDPEGTKHAAKEKAMNEFFDIPQGEMINDLDMEHFKGLIQKRGWPKISEALSILVKHSKNTNRDLYEWADDMKQRCETWVKRQEKLQG
jgi:hypothetical protein